MILLTGATGTVGSALLPMLLEAGHEVRALVREPRRLGRHRVEVRIAIGDLADLRDPHLQRQALRGVDTVIHVAAAIRDQPEARVEELNGLASAHLLRAAETSDTVERFIFFSAIGATRFQRTRFFRAKALAERAVAASSLETIVLSPSIVYDVDDPWMTIMRRLALLPVIPISGSGRAAYQPIWAGDVARCTMTALADGADGRFELAGPETLTYDQMARTIARSGGHDRRLFHVRLGVVHAGLAGLRRIVGDVAFATWEEAELMEVPMVSSRGTADAEALGVEPRRMEEVLA